MFYPLSVRTLILLGTVAVFSLCITIIPVSAQQSESIDLKGVRPVTQIVDDSSTTFRLSNFIARNSEVAKNANVNVTTVNGIVLLTGSIKTADDKLWVEDLAKNEVGVRRVVSELRVEKIRNAIVRGKDKLLQLSVKHRLSSQLKEGSAAVHVVVYRKTVYLMGYITSDIADQATEIASNTKGAERVIRVFELREQ